MSLWETKFIDEIIPIFDDIFKNLFLVCNLHQSFYIVNGIIDHRHHCTRDIPGTNFYLIPFPEVEILVGGTPLPPTFHIPCMLTIVAKSCTFKWNKTCAEAVCPGMLLPCPEALLKVIFHTTCLAYSVSQVSFGILRCIFQECT